MDCLLLKRFHQKVPVRYVMCLMCSLALFNMMTLRTNLPISLVAMTGSSESVLNVSMECPFPGQKQSTAGNSSIAPKERLFDWNQKKQGLLLSSYFIGFLLTQLAGGLLVCRFRQKWVVGLGMLGSTVLSLLAPLAAYSGYWVFFASRLLTGLFSGVVLPGTFSLIGRWAPVRERGIMLAFIYSGTTVGAIVAQFASGYLIAAFNSQGDGWTVPFYVFGGLTCVWFVFWVMLVSSSPQDHSTISQKEVEILKQELGECYKQEDLKTPWTCILTSVPFWALVCVNFSHNWGLDLFQMQLPNFFKNVLHLPIDKNGFYSSLPFIMKSVTGVLSGFISTFIQSKFSLTINFTRKICTFIAYYGAGAVLLGAGYGCDITLNITLLTLTMGVFGFYSSGPNCTYVDMSPKFSGIILGIANTISNIAGFVCPVATAHMVSEEETLENWRHVFIIASCLYFGTATLFLIFGSSELQPWADGVPSPALDNADSHSSNGQYGSARQRRF